MLSLEGLPSDLQPEGVRSYLEGAVIDKCLRGSVWIVKRSYLPGARAG